MNKKVTIVDFRMGNINSILKKVNLIGFETIVSNNPNEILKANKIILPGVGHFGKAMENLNKLNLIEPLNNFVIIQKKPILGICLGMQLMTQKSEEGNVDGFGWFDAEVIKFKIKNPYKYKIPHTGWNKLKIQKQSKLMSGINENDEFYFVHSYHTISNSQDALSETEYEYNFVSAIEKNNIFGVQYHPEKSHDAGQKLFENFLKL